jgi:hypothetical protein
VPSNKIGKLKAGQGLRRVEAQETGGWRDEEARANFEVGAELEPKRSSPGKGLRSSRWGDPHR